MEKHSIDFSTLQFRCSGLGHLMVEPRSKSGVLSEGTKTHLMDVYVKEKYGRQTDISNKYIQKGNMVEEDAITLYSLLKGEFYQKNESHLSNGFIKGTPDLFVGETIHQAHTIIDIKSSWDIFTFFRVLTKDLNKLYYWQLQGYMALSGAKSATLAYCLVNTPEILLEDEKRKLFWKLDAATQESELYQTAAAEIEKAMRYDDIPMGERCIEFHFERNESDIERLYQRVKDCRLYLSELESKLISKPLLC